MTWPTGSVPTTNVDAGTDSPASARADLLDLITKANQMIAETPKPAGRLIGVRVFGAGSYTYTPTAGTNAVLVEWVGGGGGGGAAITTTGNTGCIAGGGGSGGYARSFITSGFSGVTITVGAGGSGGAALSSNYGSNGGQTSFGSLVVVGGGYGGQGTGFGLAEVWIGRTPGIGGAATVGQIKSGGATGGWGMMQKNSVGRSGEGANSYFGGGGSAVLFYYPSVTSAPNGKDGNGYGSGGSGGAYFYDGTFPPSSEYGGGGRGADGIVIVYEYS
ncbi:MAG TPA: hypothetical protein VFM48_12565 [Aquabacterium sp.]|nr:hypothetical protein [Aquabacterium sp.]